jgi:hypothetical protein
MFALERKSMSPSISFRAMSVLELTAVVASGVPAIGLGCML